jgi:hypothetical protein
MFMVAAPVAVHSSPVVSGDIPFENTDVSPYWLANVHFEVYAPGDPDNPVDAGAYPSVSTDYTYVYTLSNLVASAPQVGIKTMTVGLAAGAQATAYGSLDDGNSGTKAPDAINEFPEKIDFVWANPASWILQGESSKPLFLTSPSGPGDVVVSVLVLSTTEDEIASGPFGGGVCGNVGVSCPGVTPEPPQVGIIVDLYDLNDVLLQTVQTDEDGNFCFYGLDAGNYLVTLVVPLGFTADSEENLVVVPVTVPIGAPITENFEVVCSDNVADPRTIGFWKHQVGTAIKGKGHQHIDTPTLCGYLDTIESRFNSNSINEVIIYASPDPASLPAGADLCEEKLKVAQNILALAGKQEMEWRAKQQLLALLLNVASGKILLTEIISDDGANVSQAITFCDNLIDLGTDYELAKTIADEINNGRMVPAGWIPLDTEMIYYARRLIEMSNVMPTVFTKSTKITFMLGGEGQVPVDLKIFDVTGRLVRTVADRSFGPGLNSVVWDGRNDYGANVATGVYFYLLSTPVDDAKGKMILRR